MFEKIFGELILIERVLAQPGGFNKPTSQPGGLNQPSPVTLPNPLRDIQTIEDLLERIVNYLMIIVIPLASIMIIWGAFQILFAGGNPEKVATGRRTVVYAAVGLAIILSASGIILVIKELLGAKF